MPAAGFAACPQAKVTKQPYAYPIVLRGPKAVIGARVGGFAAYSKQHGVWRQVPVQVEEVNANGDYVLEGGLPFTRGSDDGRFDDNDEIVVDGVDLGEDFRVEEAAEAPASSWAKRFKVAFCRGDATIGFLLIEAGAGKRFDLQSTRDAVTFQRQAGEVVTDLYTYKFDKKNPVLLGQVLLAKGQERVPAISQSTFRMPLRTPFFLPNMTFSEDDLTSSIESWQSGPLRTIVAVGVKYSSFLSLFKLHLFSELVFYRNRFVVPTVVQFVFDPSSVLKAGSGLAYALSFPKGREWQITSNLASLPLASPAEVVERGPRADKDPVYFASGHSLAGSFFVQVRVDEKARRAVPPPFLLKKSDFESAKAAEYWPWLRDLSGDLGVFLDFSQIAKGSYDFGLDLLLSPRADESFTDYGSVDSDWQRLP